MNPTLQAETRQKMAEIGQEITRLRKEKGLKFYSTKMNYGVYEHQTKGVMAGNKSYTIQTLLLLLSELNFTITITPKP